MRASCEAISPVSLLGIFSPESCPCLMSLHLYLAFIQSSDARPKSHSYAFFFHVTAGTTSPNGSQADMRDVDGTRGAHVGTRKANRGWGRGGQGAKCRRAESRSRAGPPGGPPCPFSLRRRRRPPSHQTRGVRWSWVDLWPPLLAVFRGRTQTPPTDVTRAPSLTRHWLGWAGWVWKEQW